MATSTEEKQEVVKQTKTRLNNGETKIAKVVGKRLMHLRLHHGNTQRQMAEKIGCNQTYISEWESGMKFVPTRYIYRIMQEFMVPMSFFDQNVPGVEALFPDHQD